VGRANGGYTIVIGRTVRTRLGAVGVAVGLVVAGSIAGTATLGASSAGASSQAKAHPLAVPLPSGTTVTCSQISGNIQLRPGIGLTGTSSGVKWKLMAVANNCTYSGGGSAGTVPYTGTILGAIVKGSGYILPNNTCATATAAANYGASTLKIQWIASPTVGPALYSSVATGAFLAGTTIDATGLTQSRLNTGPTPVSFDLGGDWTAATAAQLATDCAGPAPATRVAVFQTPTGAHLPAFVAVICAPSSPRA
jgi:hypothetical protein